MRKCPHCGISILAPNDAELDTCTSCKLPLDPFDAPQPAAVTAVDPPARMEPHATSPDASPLDPPGETPPPVPVDAVEDAPTNPALARPEPDLDPHSEVIPGEEPERTPTDPKFNPPVGATVDAPAAPTHWKPSEDPTDAPLPSFMRGAAAAAPPPSSEPNRRAPHSTPPPPVPDLSPTPLPVPVGKADATGAAADGIADLLEGEGIEFDSEDPLVAGQEILDKLNE